MDIYTFEKLNLKTNDLIIIEKVGSYQYPGVYLGDFNHSKLTFKFSNHSNGKTEIIELKKLQQIRRK
jgi:hypothetical protein